jgi:ABC-type amino acid transport substrate-binding protein
VRAATAVPGPEQKAKSTDTEKTAASSPIDTDHLVAVLMARPEIKSVSDLAGKSVAIDIRQSNGSVRTAIAAAGAAEVQLSEGQTTAINRVASGEVPAAVLALVSPEAAEAFPEIAGFRIFRVPLSPRALKERPNTP